MRRNVGNADRIVRAILAIGAIVWAGALGWSSVGAIVLLVVAAVLLVTAAVGFCPLYRALGISTRGATLAGSDAGTRPGKGRLTRIDPTNGQSITVVDGLETGVQGSAAMPPSFAFSSVAVSRSGTVYVTGDLGSVVYRLQPLRGSSR